MNFNKDNEQKLVNNRHKENTQATNCDRFDKESFDWDCDWDWD